MEKIVCKQNDCFWQCGDESECYFCSHNENAKEKKGDRYITVLGKFNELYNYLRGIKLPERLSPTCKMPKLTAKRAFGIIYVLQEITCCLPDCIEQCRGCLDLYDSELEGYSFDDQYQVDGKTLAKKYWGNWCESCIPDIEFEVK